MAMLGLSDRDRSDMRTGAMRAQGARWSNVIFWTTVGPRLVAGGVAIAIAIAAVWGSVQLWHTKIYPSVASGGPVVFVAVVFGIVVVVSAVRWLFRPRGHYRRGAR